MDEKLAAAGDKLVAALGRQSDFWGLGRITGEIYAVLYIGAEALTLEQIARYLKVTKGNISIAIRPLEQLGMVRRSWRPGDRRIFFEAESDFWKIAHSVASLRQKPEFDQSFALVKASAQLAREAIPSPERQVFLERLAALQDFYRLLDSVAGTVLALGPTQLKAVVQMLQLVAGNRATAGFQEGQE